MFGTLGFSELIIILVIVLIIFGAGRLPQIGEGVGKALRGFKKEVHEAPPPVDPQNETSTSPTTPPSHTVEVAHVVAQPPATDLEPSRSAPYQPGPELTPGTTAALMAAGAGPQPAQAPRQRAGQPTAAQATTSPGQPNAPSAPPSGQSAAPPTMEERLTQPRPVQASYPPLPPTAQGKPGAKRPSAVVNKDAVARVQAQQAAMKAQAVPSPQAPSGKGAGAGVSPNDMQGLGESLGDALRTFRQAAADVRGSIDPEMRTIRAEMEAAQKEIEQSMEAAKQMPAVHEDPPKPS